MIEKNKYSIDKRGGVNYMSMAFYVTPQVNSIVRVGSQEEKEFVFSALLDSNKDVLVPSGKRGDDGKLVSLVDEAVRIAGNVKNRQTQIQDSLLEQTQAQIEEQANQSVLVVKLEAGTTVPGMAGVFANKLQSTYQKPSFLRHPRRYHQSLFRLCGTLTRTMTRCTGPSASRKWREQGNYL